MNLYTPSTIRDIQKRYDFRFSKSLGQNFITDMHVIDSILEGAGIGEEDLVIEIGPGIGVLTAAAAEAAAKVVAIEIDSKLMPILEETLRGFDNIEIINRDVLKTDLNEIIEEQREKNAFTGAVRIIGNLPYYITTPIIMQIFENGTKADSVTVMMQKEVADRISSGPGTREYGAISVAAGYYCQVEKILAVPKEVFLPQPKVDSAVLHFIIRKEKPVELISENVFFTCIKAGFGKRRKTLLNAMTGACGMAKDEVKTVLQEAGIEPSRRAETLRIDEFASIANTVAEYIGDRGYHEE